MMENWLGDLRVALRGCRRTPGVSFTIVATLALGLGLVSAIFAFADGYLFRPLPFPDANRNYSVSDPQGAIASALTEPDTDALRQSAVRDWGFVQLDSGHRVRSSEILVGDRPIPFYVQDVSRGFRTTVALPLALGRDFADDDHRDAEPIPVWLNYRFWTREFGGDRGVLGQSFRTAGSPPQRVVVVGILGPTVSAFDLNNRPPDAIAPAVPQPPNPRRLSFPIVRIPAGITVDQATAEIGHALTAASPAADGKPRIVRLRSLTDTQVAGGRPTARVLFAGALLILLLAAINLVHLLLARGVARADEIATRAALGASPWRVTRLFLTESLALGAAGIASGLLLGAWLSGLIEARVPRYPTGGRNMALVPMLFDWRVVAFASALGVTISIAGGLWPAQRALRRSLASNSRSGSGLAAVIPARLSRSILASEMAVATIIMIGTLFIGAGIWRYLHQPLGFDYVDRFGIAIATPDQRPLSAAEFEGVRRALETVPGVDAAGARTVAMIDGVEVPGRTLGPKQLAAAGATSGYFAAWNLRLRRGRWFAPSEFTGQEPVAVVDEKAATLAWPDADAVGRDIRVAGIIRRIVGVIEPRRESLMRETPGRVYVPVAQPDRWSSLVAWAPRLAVSDVESRVRPAIASILPGSTVKTRPVTFEDLFLREVGEAEFQAPIMAAFGALAFALAAIGVFGLVSYLVEQRTREFGIRIALGAEPVRIWRSVIRQSVVPALVGLALGAGGAWALESVVRASVFGWPSSGGTAVSVVSAALLAVSILAAMVPARRAMRVDPATALRTD